MLFLVFHTIASDTKSVKIETLDSYTEANLQTLVDAQKKAGYLYAGMYSEFDETNTDNASTSVKFPKDGEKYLVKFIPSEVLTIKAQVSDVLFDEVVTNDTSSSIRMVTSIDSVEYKHVGFIIKKGDGDPSYAKTTYYVQKKLYAIDYDTNITNDELLKTAKEYTPQELFHAESTFFKTWTIKKIPDTAYNTDITIVPYYITFDGTEVQGTTGIKTVNLGRSWVYVDNDSTSTQQLGTFNAPFKTLEEAIAYVDNGDPRRTVESTLLVKENYPITKAIDINRSLTLTSANMDPTVNEADTQKLATITTNLTEISGGMFDVNAGKTMTVKAITLDGSSNTATSKVRAVYISSGATLNLDSYATITNFDSSVSGAAVYNYNGALNLTGNAEISGNTTTANGNDVYSVGTMTMDDNAYVGSVYLADNNIINLNTSFEGKTYEGQVENIIDGEDDPATLNVVTEVIHPTYANNSQILSSEDKELLAKKCEAFAVPDSETTYIDETGYLEPCVARIPQSDGNYKYYATLQKAVMAVPKTGVQTEIQVVKDFTLTEPVSVPNDNNRNILLTDDGNTRTITRGFVTVTTYGGRMLVLRKGNQMTIEGSSKSDTEPSLVFDGAEKTAGTDTQIIAVGASYANRGGTLTLNSGVKLTGNNNNTGGGAVVVFGTFNMTGGVIDGNETQNDHGGGVYIRNEGTMTMTGGTISNNQCTHVGVLEETGEITLDKDGGAVYVEAGANFTMKDGMITGNSAKSGAAVILATYSTGRDGDSPDLVATMDMTGGTISGNEAAVEGGAIYVHANSEFDMTGGTIRENSSGKAGGAIYIRTNSGFSNGKHGGRGQATLSKGSIITDNEAKSTGGGAICNGGDLTIDGCEITLNKAIESHGGAMYITEDGKTTFISGNIDGNQCTSETATTTRDGGAVYVFAGGNLDMQGGTIQNNSAISGGAVLLAASNDSSLQATMKMSGGTIQNNEASVKGGAVFVHANAKLEITSDDAVISNNSSVKGGGAIYIYVNTEEYSAGAYAGKGYANITGGKFEGNITQGTSTETYGGGAICVEGNLDLKGGTFTDNETTEGNGGAVYVSPTGQLDMSGGKLEGNKAQYGGALYVSGLSAESYAKAKVSENAVIQNNEASVRGGGVYIQVYGQFDMAGGTICENNATTGGGGVYITTNSDNSACGIMSMSGGSVTDNTITNATVSSTGTIEGYDVHVAGTLSIGADGYIESLYVISESKIGFESALNSRDTATEVVVSTTRYGSQTAQYVLDSSSLYTASNYKYFKLPEGQPYYINSSGALTACEARVKYEGETLYSYYSTLQTAINAAKTDGTLTTVELMKDIIITQSLDMAANRKFNILLTDDGYTTRTITRGNYTGTPMFNMRTGNTLTIAGKKGNDETPSLIFDGGSKTNPAGDQSIIKVGTSGNQGGSLILRAGVQLCNNVNGASATGDGDGGAIHVSKTGTLTMRGGVISGNKSDGAEGGAILLREGCTFTMEGGRIENNEATMAGGAIAHICEVNNNTDITNITISGGSITGNKSTGTSGTNGGAIFVHATGVLTLSGATTVISGNTATGSGGGVYLHNNTVRGAAASMSITKDVKITNNTANVKGGGVCKAASTNTITGDTSGITLNYAPSGTESNIYTP